MKHSDKSKTVKVGLVQMAAGPNKADNVERALVLVREAATRGATLVCLQE